MRISEIAPLGRKNENENLMCSSKSFQQTVCNKTAKMCKLPEMCKFSFKMSCQLAALPKG